MPAPASAADARQRSGPAARQAPARSPDWGIRQVFAKARPAKPAILIDRQSCIPLYAQVAEQIEAAIQSGDLSPGDRIASDDLAEMLGLSQTTLLHALQTLIDRGLLLRQRGVGTFVSPGQLRRAVKLCSLYEDLQNAGREPTTKVLVAKAQAVDAATAESLNVEEGSIHWYLERLRLAEAEPLAILINWLPCDVINPLETDLNRVGLYPALRAQGETIHTARQQIGARRATAREARMLDMRSGQPLLTVRRTTFNDKGRAIEYGTHCYRPDLYNSCNFELTLSAG
jgi:GntR family transcriptional regulator